MIMNFHIYVLITTVLYYIVLKMFKKESSNETKKTNYFIYILFVPILLYITRYIYFLTSKDIETVQIKKPSTISSSSSSSVLSEPYPASTI